MKSRFFSLFSATRYATLAAAGMTVLGLSSAHALTWSPGGAAQGSGNWNTTALNWEAGTTAWTQTSGIAALNTAIFAGSDGTHTVTLGEALAAQTLTFNAGGYTLAGAQTLSVTNNGNGVTTIASGKTATIGNGTAATVVDFRTGSDTGTRTALGGTGTVLNIAAGSTYKRTGGPGGAPNPNGTAAAFGFQGTGTINVSGTVAYQAPAGGIYGGIVLSQVAGSNLTMNVNNGGVVSSNGQFNGIALTGSFTGSTTTAVLNVNSGGLVTTTGNGASGGINLADQAGTNGTLNLNAGGTVSTFKIQNNYVTGLSGGSGTVNFDGGTLKPIANNANFLTASNAWVRAGGAVIDSNGFDVTIVQSLNSHIQSLGGGLTKRGAGSLTIASESIYTGSTVVEAGTLGVTGSLPATPSITVASGASFSGTGSTGGTLAFAGGGGSRISVNVAGGFTANGVAFNGAVQVGLTGDVVGGTTYDVVKYGAGTLTGLANLTSTRRGEFANDTLNQKITFIAGDSSAVEWAAPGGTGTWQIGGTAKNWFNSPDELFWNGDTVSFYDPIIDPTANGTVTLSGMLEPASVTVSNFETNYTFAGSGLIAGSGSLTKNSEGTLTVQTANTYTGGTTLNAGTLVLAGAGKIGTGGALTVNAGTLDLGGTTQTFAGITFAGGTIRNGAIAGGTMAKAIDGESTFSGAGTSTLANVYVTAGSLKITSGTINVATTAGDTYLAGSGILEVSGGALNINGAASWFTVSGASGTPQLVVSGGNVTIANNWGMPIGGTGTGVLTVSSGKIRVAPAVAGYALQIGESAGSRGVVNLDGGTLEAKLVRPGVGNAADPSKFYFNGGILSPTASAADWFTNGANMDTQIRPGGAIIDTAGFDAAILEVIGNSTLEGEIAGTFTKLGAGALTLSAANTYTGATTVSAGTLVISGSLSTGTVTVASGATLGGTGALGGSVAIQSGGHQAFAIAATAGAQVARPVAGALNLAAGNVLDLTAAAAPADGSYVLLTAAGGITGTPGTVNLTGVAGVVSVQGNSLVLTVGAGGGGYASWAAGFPFTAGVNDGPTQDPDNDGISNLLEYVLGGIPVGTGAANRSILPVQTLTATDLVLTFQRADLSEADAVVKVQWSSDLVTWNDFATVGAASALPGVQVTEDSPTAALDTVVVRIPRSTAAGGKLFSRVIATKP